MQEEAQNGLPFLQAAFQAQLKLLGAQESKTEQLLELQCDRLEEIE